MSLQDILMQRANIHFQNEGLGPNVLPPNTALADSLYSIVKENQDQRRRQQNISDQMSQYQQMMETMSQMPDNSNIGKANELTEDDVKQRASGIIGSSTMIPTREVSFGPDGINMKLGFKSASPTDQKNLMDIQQTQSNMQREEMKRQFLTEYINGNLPEGVFLKEMGNLGLTPDEFQQATAARQRLMAIQGAGQGRGTPIPMNGQVVQSQNVQTQAQNGTPNAINANGNEYIPKTLKRDEFGNLVPSDYQLKTTDKTQEEIAAGNRMAQQSVNMVTGSLQELAKTYADAIKEGGVGGRLASIKSGAAQWMGGTPAENFPATSAFPGQKTEVIARMMPLLTQHGDKPGSVRLVQTVFDKLEKTLPDETTPPKNARRMMEQTIRNMFRFARAAQMIGISDQEFDSLPQDQKNGMTAQLEQLASNVQLSPEEEGTVKNVIDSALQPIDNLIGSKSSSKNTDDEYQRYLQAIGQ